MSFNPVWWLPTLTAFFIAGMFYLVYAFSRKRRLSAPSQYRVKYQQVVGMFFQITEQANILGRDIDIVQDKKLLAYYESTLKILEMLLQITQKLPPVGMDLHTVNSIHYLTKDCRSRFERLTKAFRTAKKGKRVTAEQLLGKATEPSSILPAGCYFCSLPYEREKFAVVRVKIDEAVKEVWGCETCREELQYTRKVKVLYFLKDGKPVHWSEIPGYQPSEDYWVINKKDSARKPKLELIKHGDGLPPQPG